MKTLSEKLDIVRRYNTFYISDSGYEQKVAEDLDKGVNMVKVFGKNLTRKRVVSLLEKEPLVTFDFLMLSTGISKELWKSLMLARKHLPREVQVLMNRRNWAEDWTESETNYRRGLMEDKEYRKGVANLFTEGYKAKRFCNPVNQIKFNLNVISDLANAPDSVIRRVVEVGVSGRNRATKALLEEEIPRQILNKMGIPYVSGMNPKFQRNVDTIVNKNGVPTLAIENSHFVTTNSTQTEKAKRFVASAENMRNEFHGIKIIGFVDGPGWLRRESALMELLDSLDDVYTYSRSQIKRFANDVSEMNLVEVAAA